MSFHVDSNINLLPLVYSDNAYGKSITEDIDLVIIIQFKSVLMKISQDQRSSSS